MPDRIVYFGEFKNVKKEELFTKAINKLKVNKGDKFYYLLPNGDLLTSYREKLINEVNSCFEINLFTFDDVANKILKGKGYLSIDSIWKSFIIKQVLDNLVREGEISYYKDVSKKQGFIESLSFIIGEIKRSLVTPEQFLKNSPDTSKYEEIGMIYNEYEKYMEERNIIDKEGTYSKVLQILNSNKSNFEDVEFIIIDEFYDFRPIEREILKAMSASSADIYINIPFSMEYKSSILDKTINTLIYLGFNIEQIKQRKGDLFTDIGKSFFNYGADKLKYTDKISLIQSPSSYLELKKVLSKVKHLHASGKTLDTIGIAVLSEDYKEELIQVSIEEKLPISIGIETKLIKIPFIRDFLNALENNYKSLEKTIEIKKKDSFENYYDISLELIEKKQIKDKIKDIYLEIGDFELYKRDILAFEKLLNVLLDIQKIEVWENSISFEDYFELILKYLKTETITMKNGNPNGIKIMNPLNTRGFQYDVLFMVGLSQNEYPVLKDNNFLLRDEYASELKEIGINYWDYSDRLDNEVIKFANLVSTVRDKLYLSYSTEKQGIPSMFLEELLDRFENPEIEEKIDFIKLELDYIFKNKLDEITTNQELINYLILNLDKEVNEENNIFAFYNFLEEENLIKINRKMESEYHRSLEEFNKYKGKLTRENIVDDIKRLHKDKIYSSTYLESYSKCPFAFFMKNILEIDEIDNGDELYTARDIGSIYHEVLKFYYKKYKLDIKAYVKENIEFNIEDTLDYLKRQIMEQARSRQLDISKRSGILVLETVYLNLKEYIQNDIYRLKTSKEKSIPFDFEVEFGRSQEFIIDVGGDNIRLTGKIDRIDKIIDEEKYILIDYKSGSSGIYDIDSMRAGISLQIPLYMLAQREKNIVLSMYGQIKKSEFLSKIGVIDQTSLITKSNKGAITIHEKEELLDNTRKHIKDIVDNICSADFSVNPKECSSYCIYRDICRYDHLMEVEI